MRNRLIVGLLGVCVFVLAGVAAADSATGEASKPEATAVSEDNRRATGAFEPKSFWFVGTSNYHLRLGESEGDVDRLLDTYVFKALMPRWTRPTTFKDWSQDFRIWDLWMGYGRDINEQFAWSVYAGGGAGTVHNSGRYFPLGIPLKIDADFYRQSILIGSSVTYYFAGRPVKDGRGLGAILRGTRPLVEMNAGITFQKARGDVEAALPFIGRVMAKEDETTYNLIWLSPRVGAEIPISESNSINALCGYLFFLDHAKDYNGILLEFFVRHRF